LHIQVDRDKQNDDDDDFQIEQELPAETCSQVNGILQDSDSDKGMMEDQGDMTDQDGNDLQTPQVPVRLTPLAEVAKETNVEQLADALQGARQQVRNSQV
jgi:hypothetical protein